MARPTKQGIDYFSLDCDFDNSIEMYLIEKGASGLGILVTIWQMIYSNEGYFIQDNKDLHLLIKRKIDVDVNEVSDCINVCLSRNIFDKDLYEKYQILTSRGVQKRYFDAAKKKKVVQIHPEYILIDISSYLNLVNSSVNKVNSSGNATKEEEEVKEEVKEKENSPVVDVFTHWQEVLKHPRAKLDDERKKIIKRALKTYSLEELKQAILGCSVTPHNMGKNDRGEVYDGLHVIFKDSNNIERFINNSIKPPSSENRSPPNNFKTTGQMRTQGNIDAANKFLERTGS